jgi:hypothetical protein
MQHVLARFGHPIHPVSRVESQREFDRSLRQAGFEKLQSTMVGFGPFSFFKRQIPRRIGIGLDGALQHLADAGTPVLAGLGHGYIVLCRKNE